MTTEPRKFGVKVRWAKDWGDGRKERFFLVVAHTPQLALEVIHRECGESVEVFWKAFETQEYRDAWRDKKVDTLTDRHLPDGIE